MTVLVIKSNNIKETTESATIEYNFIGGDVYPAPVVAITQSGTTTYYNILRDYLGNITHVVNASNNSVVAEYSYDAWGRMRNPSTWTDYAQGSEPALFIAGRGFTGHVRETQFLRTTVNQKLNVQRIPTLQSVGKHLPWFNLINMNGRAYDALTGRFLSPDNFVQAPDFTQNYNRYTYCLNNPLKYTDPSGFLSITQISYSSYLGAQKQGYQYSYAQFCNDVVDCYWNQYFDNPCVQGGGGESSSIGGGGASGSMTFTWTTQTSSQKVISRTVWAPSVSDPNKLQAYYMPGENFVCGNGETHSITIDVGTLNHLEWDNGYMLIPGKIQLDDGRGVTVSFNFTSKDGKNGNQNVRIRLVNLLKDALNKTPGIVSIDISSTTNGNHNDPRHAAGLAMDIDNFNGMNVFDNQDSQLIIDFQKSLETNQFLYQDFGPLYNFYPGHQNHVHFSINYY